jgi:mono/diheme cytochrome c family protein
MERDSAVCACTEPSRLSVSDSKPKPDRALIWSISLLAALCVAGCRSRTALTPEQADGKHLYDVRCAHCHEENDLGLKKVPPNLHRVFQTSNLPSGLPATDAEVAKAVIDGRGMMPAFAGRFSDQQMSDLLAYLHRGIR